MNMQVMDWDAALGYVTSQRSHIETEVLKRKYPTIRYAQIVPIDTSANPFAPSVTFFAQDSVGKAKIMNGKGDDVPLANIYTKKFEETIQLGGIGYSFSIEEIGAAAQIGRNLSSDGADAARMAYEQLVDETVLNSFYNAPGITTVAAAKTFALSTAHEILSEINKVLAGIFEDSEGRELADSLILPIAQYAHIATQPLSQDNEKTVMEFIQKANIYTVQTGQPLTIIADHRVDKMIAYRRDPQVVKAHMPMPLRFLNPQPVNLEIKVPGMFRFSESNIRNTKAIRWLTGV